MPDYTKLATTAKRLVEKAGKTITFVKLDETVSNTEKPWKNNSDNRTTADEKILSGVFVEPSSATKLGMSTETSDLLKRSSQIVIVASTDDLEDYNEIIDSNLRWKIQGIEKLKPADITLLYFIGVSR